jgi:hypothetical protein
MNTGRIMARKKLGSAFDLTVRLLQIRCQDTTSKDCVCVCVCVQRWIANCGKSDSALIVYNSEFCVKVVIKCNHTIQNPSTSHTQFPTSSSSSTAVVLRVAFIPPALNCNSLASVCPRIAHRVILETYSYKTVHFMYRHHEGCRVILVFGCS